MVIIIINGGTDVHKLVGTDVHKFVVPEVMTPLPLEGVAPLMPGIVGLRYQVNGVWMASPFINGCAPVEKWVARSNYQLHPVTSPCSIHRTKYLNGHVILAFQARRSRRGLDSWRIHGIFCRCVCTLIDRCYCLPGAAFCKAPNFFYMQLCDCDA